MSSNDNTTGNQPKKKTRTPEKVIRHGAIAASIWLRTADSGYQYYDYTLSRSWKSGNKQGYKTTFFHSNEHHLTAVVEEATAWIQQQIITPPCGPQGERILSA